MRLVRHIMGLPISIDVPAADDPVVFKPVFQRLVQIDERFSPFKATSEVSLLAASTSKRTFLLDKRNVLPKGLSEEMKRVVKACLEAERWTDGYFSAWAAGAFDPSGYVKGWAIAEAGKIIEKQGFKTYCIGAGGDVLAASDGAKTWHIGIQDPCHKSKMLNKLSISNGAVATSGNYARGAHIINPKTRQPADELLSITVTGPDIIQADVLATAGFAMGPKAFDFMRTQSGYQALIIDRNGRLLSTPGFPNHNPGSSR